MLTGNYSIRQVTEIANKEWGFTTRKTKRIGGNPLGQSTAYKIFTSQFYAGVLEFKGETYPGMHQPMITLQEFDAVQEVLGRKGKPRPKTHRFALTGLIRCGECGCMFTAETKKGRYTYYHCTRKRRDVDCSQRYNVREEDLESQIDSLLSGFTILPEFRDWALEALRASNDNEIVERTQIQLNLSKRALDLQRQIDNLTQMRYRDLLNDEEFLAEKQKLKGELSAAQAQLRDAEARADKWLELTEEVFNFATNARENFKTGDMDTKKTILRSIGQNPVILDRKLTIEANKWLVPIIEEYPAIEREYERVRTTTYASTKEKTSDMTLVSSSWLRVVGDVRTASSCGPWYNEDKKEQ